MASEASPRDVAVVVVVAALADTQEDSMWPLAVCGTGHFAVVCAAGNWE